jgi:hypothetical protein
MDERPEDAEEKLREKEAEDPEDREEERRPSGEADLRDARERAENRPDSSLSPEEHDQGDTGAQS